MRLERLPAPPMADGELVLEPPPEVPKAVPVNPLARLLPVAMIVAAIGMMVLYFGSGGAGLRSPMFVFFPVMMLVSLVGTLAFGARGGPRTAEINQGRRDYLRYLDGVDHAAADAARAQYESRNWTHPDPASLWTLVGGRRMWERRPGDPDFGHVRIGLGAQRSSTRLVTPDTGPVDEADPVTITAMRQLVHTRRRVDAVPVAVPLSEAGVLTVGGDAARAIICQLAVLHSPADVRIAAVVGDSTAQQWEWLKWLPHHQHPYRADDLGPARLTYHDMAEAQRDMASLNVARTVVVVDGGWTPGEFADGAVLVVAPSTTGGLIVDGAERVVPDTLSLAQATVCARRLARFRMGCSPDGAGRSPIADWAQLIGVGDLGQLDVPGQWRVLPDARRLRVPIGIGEHGAPIHLDIKEAAQRGLGPHGLCVGATGSGKSEFLRTLVLGLVTTHPPEALNLILVDFKGGATFLGFERVRHVSAVITNLAEEAHLVARMKDALAGEMNRRQELLRAAGNIADVGEYQRVRADGGEALAPLLIIVDEFSELLAAHPDFAELFVAIGRVGRSLGMHLLLASQRLDEGRLRGLETHLSYRICLKTFSASESRAVLGVADAYGLPNEPGAAYLKTASGDLTRFRTAFVSGPGVEPVRRRVPNTTPTATPFTAAARSSGPTDGGPGRPPVPSRTILDTVLDRLAGHGTPAHRVWLPPLTTSPTLGALLSHAPACGPLTVPIGIVDCPYEQRREPLLVELAGAAGNVAIVGGTGSGKSTAVRTLALALAAGHDPRDVQIYCLDFGGGSLTSLRALPHVGAVAGRHEPDLVRRTIAEIEAIVRGREVAFRRTGIDSFAEYRRRRAAGDPAAAADPFGDVFLMVDGWATARQDFDGIEAPITALASQGLSFGVHIVVAAARWAEIRPACKDQLGTRIELRLGDPAESEMDRKRARLLVDSPPGLGITRQGRDMVIALPRLDEHSTTDGLAAALDAGGALLRARYPDRSAPPIRLLPQLVSHAAVVADADTRPQTEILIGVGERELRPVALDFADQPHLVILGDTECGKTAALRTLCTEIVRTTDAAAARLVLVDVRRTLLGVVEGDHLYSYAMSGGAVSAQLPPLLATLAGRLPGADVTQRQLRTRSWWSGPEIYVIVDDYDLVAGGAGNTLTPLLEYLPHAKDLGLHMVVARRSGGAARAMFDPVLACLRDLGCMGLMMSASPDEGVLLGSVRARVLPTGRATLVSRSAPEQLVQIAWTDPP